MSNEFVSNASPLIVLARAGHLGLLERTCREVLLPQEVLDEVNAGPPGDPCPRLIRDAHWIRVLPRYASNSIVTVWNLGAGESSVLSQCLTRPGAKALLDDRLGRTAARAMGINVRGTLGILVLAKRQGVIGQVSPLIDSIIEAGLFVAPALRERCLRLAGESP